jgi:hypothetical protein
MAVQPFKKLQGMEMEFVSGKLEEYPRDRAIGYTVTFKLVLDFTHFKQMADVWFPGYLEGRDNAIRPELGGLAYHNNYSRFGGNAGSIVDNEKLFAFFTNPEPYLDGWISDLEMVWRFHKPVFRMEGDALFITARQDFRWDDPLRQITIKDLGVIPFHWALTLIELVAKQPWPVSSAASKRVAPVQRVTFMYTQEEIVFVDGEEVLKGARYVSGKTLSFGPITDKQVHTAG